MKQDSDQLKYMVGLSLAMNVGAVTFRKLIEEFGSVESIFQASPKDLSFIKRLPKTLCDELKSGILIEKAQKEIGEAEKNKIDIISILDARYPDALKSIYDAPMVLYVRGSFPDEKMPIVAVVGSRNASYYGIRMAKKIAADLSKSGVIVVSGMAIGVDSAAHEGALSEDGITLAVLGGGLARIYPSENKKIADQIIKRGALISEYPLNMPPQPQFFPMRNRIISGLSQAVLVVEAGEKSGALITVDTALEQGREVFAVPGNADSKHSSGTNALIKQGAKLITCAEDILEELELKNPTNTCKNDSSDVKVSMNEEENRLFSLLNNEPLNIDTLIEQSGTAPGKTISNLSGLQLKGIVKELPGKNFTRNI